MKLRILGYKLAGLYFSLYLNWQDHCIRGYQFGIDFLCWGAQVDAFFGKGPAPWSEEMKPQALKVLRLGPRVITVSGKLIGTCDDLSLTITEATEEEIEELQGANEIGLVRKGRG